MSELPDDLKTKAKTAEQLFGTPTFNDVKPDPKWSKSTVSPYPGMDLVQELMNEQLVSRRLWEQNPEDADAALRFMHVQGEIYARLKRDLEANGNTELTAWYETAQGWDNP